MVGVVGVEYAALRTGLLLIGLLAVAGIAIGYGGAVLTLPGSGRQMENGAGSCIIPANVDAVACGTYFFPKQFANPPTVFLEETHPAFGNYSDAFLVPGSSGMVTLASNPTELFGNNTEFMTSMGGVFYLGMNVVFESSALGVCSAVGSQITLQYDNFTNANVPSWRNLISTKVDCTIGASETLNPGTFSSNPDSCVNKGPNGLAGVMFVCDANATVVRVSQLDPLNIEVKKGLAYQPGSFIPYAFRLVGSGSGIFNLLDVTLWYIHQERAHMDILLIAGGSLYFSLTFDQAPVQHDRITDNFLWFAVDPGCVFRPVGGHNYFDGCVSSV